LQAPWSLGFGHREIATEFARRYNLRPRTAWREAHGWSLNEAAEHINAYAAGRELDRSAIAAITAPHLCETESWPGYREKPTGRRPSPYLLSLLAAVYGCTVMDLTDLADRQRMPQSELLIMEKYSQCPPVIISDPNDPARGQSPHGPDQPADAHAGPQADAGRAVRSCLSIVPVRIGLPAVPRLPDVPYRWMQEPQTWVSWIEREVAMTAHESSDHAERALAFG